MDRLRLNPTNDFSFRRIFGAEDNKDVTTALINAIIHPDVPVTEIEIKNPFSLADYDGQKETIVDVKACDERGRWFNVDMQLLSHVALDKRMLFYNSKVYVDQLDKGVGFSSLNPVVSIWILDFVSFKGDDRPFRRLVFKDDETNETYPGFLGQQHYVIELPKFKKTIDAITTNKERWAFYFNVGADYLDVALPPELEAEPMIVKAVRELKRIGLNPAERALYEAEEEKRMLDQGHLDQAKIEAKLDGIEEGLEKGIEKGIQQGLQQAQRDQIATLTRVMNRRLGAVPDNVVRRMTNLTPEELNALTEDLFDLRSYDDIAAWFTRH